MDKNSRSLPVISLLAATLLWGSSFIALKWAFMYYDPMVIIFGRMVVASTGFALFHRYLGGNVRQKGDLLLLMTMALCEPCLYFVFEAMALQRTTASQAGMITAMFPLLVALGAHIFLKEKIRSWAVAGFIVATVGVFILSLSGSPSSEAPDPVTGNILELMAMVSSTGYTLLLKKLSSRYNPFFLTAFQSFSGSVFFLPALFLPSTVIPETVEKTPVLLTVYLGLFVSVGAYGLFNFGVSRIPATQAIAFVNLTPVFAVVLACAILGEKFNSTQYMASLLVLAGVFMCQITEREKAPPVLKQH